MARLLYLEKSALAPEHQHLLASIAIDVEPEYQQYLERYPLPSGGT